MTSRAYVGRFAPSPTGPLHAGSLVAALASYLDALVHGGRWLLRIDDADLSRVQNGAADTIAAQLKHYGFVWHGNITHTQDSRPAHQVALDQLQQQGLLYTCQCSRADLASLPTSYLGERVYDKRCEAHPITLNLTRALRLRVVETPITFTDRWSGTQKQSLTHAVGDFVVWRPASAAGSQDDAYNYQLTMPVDDAAAGVTHVVRGADLLGNTARQCYVLDQLCLARPHYLHVPLVTTADGVKLSKQHGAPALPVLPSNDPIPWLNQTLVHLGCGVSSATHLPAFWRDATAAWARKLTQLPHLP